MITVLSILALFTFGVLVARFGDGARASRVEVRCRCGRKAAVVYVVDACDEERLSRALSEWCPGCRMQEDRHAGPASALPSV